MQEVELKAALKDAMKAKDKERVKALRMVMSEIPRLNKKANQKVTDAEITKIVNKLIKSELLTLEYSGVDESESDYVNILKSFLPRMMSEQEISKWILDNIDLSTYNSNIQAMSAVMRALNGKADGKVVRNVLANL